MNKTKIAWTDYTWNPITGCSKISEGCKNCYAEAMMSRFNWSPEIQFHPERLEEPLHRKKPANIFVCSMGDLFHENVPDEWIGEVSRVMVRCPQHIFQILTKRADRMLKFYEKWQRSGVYGFCNNVWPGVTVESSKYLWRVEKLLQIQAAVRFVSLEPLLEEVNISQWMPPFENCDHYAGGCTRPENVFAETGNPRFRPGIVSCKPEYCVFGRRGLDWVIVGAETGPGRRECKIEWVRSIVQQCAAACVPCFVKQIEVNGKISHDMSQCPEDLRVRQWPEKGVK